MTKREMLEAVAAGKMNEEIQAKAQATLEAMDSEKSKRAAKQAEKSAEAYAPFIEKFVDALTDEPQTASVLLPLFEGMITPSGKEPSVQFVTAVAKKAIAQDLAEKVDVKVANKGTQKGYKLAK